MVRRVLAVLAASSVAACSLVAGLGDHHLFDDVSEGGILSGDGSDGGDGTPPSGVPPGTTPPGTPPPPPADGGSTDGDAADDAPDDAPGDVLLESDADDLPTPLVIASGQVSPATITGGGTYIFWVDEATAAGPGAIMRVALTGPPDMPVAIAPDRANPVGLRVAPNQATAFWTEDVVAPDVPGGVYSVPFLGGTITTLESDGFGYGPLGIGTVNLFSEAYALDGSGSHLRRVSQTAPAGAPTCFTSDSVSPHIRALVIDGTGNYFFDDDAQAIMVGAIDCFAPVSVFASAQSDVRHITDHNGQIWWVTSDSVYTMSTATPGGTPTLVASGFSELASIIDWNAGIAFVDAAAGKVYVVLDADGVVRMIAKNQGEPRGVYVGSAGIVYWTNHATGEVMRLAL